jgi:hypothetical protein
VLPITGWTTGFWGLYVHTPRITVLEIINRTIPVYDGMPLNIFL